MTSNNNKVEEMSRGLKSELLLRCGCRLDVHAQAYHGARTTIELANGQKVYK